MSQFYVLSFDAHKTDASALHDIIETSNLVQNWSHYLASSYILKSSASANELTDHIIEKWPNNRFLIIEITPSNSNGWMPKKQWEWFKSRLP